MRDHVVIVGGGVAAMRCAFELREQGFDGRLCMPDLAIEFYTDVATVYLDA